MSESARISRIWPVILVGVVYFGVGYGSAALDPSIPDQRRFMWRLAAWIVSAAVFFSHVGYAHFRSDGASAVTARQTALAVALGAFLLAVAATVHATVVAPRAQYWRFLIALAVWPTITAVPAFLVAFAAVATLARFSTRRPVNAHR
jgi:hypothetical protein